MYSMDMLIHTSAARIRQLRWEKGFETYWELALSANKRHDSEGLQEHRVIEWEQGKSLITASEALILSELLDAPAGYIMGFPFEQRHPPREIDDSELLALKEAGFFELPENWKQVVIDFCARMSKLWKSEITRKSL